MKTTQTLGDFEQVMLLAIMRLKLKGAYGVAIKNEIAEKTTRDPAPGAIYTTLDRLESKGFVNSSTGEATPERGGRAKRYYFVTGTGLKALQRSQLEYKNLLKGLDLFGGSHA